MGKKSKRRAAGQQRRQQQQQRPQQRGEEEEGQQLLLAAARPQPPLESDAFDPRDAADRLIERLELISCMFEDPWYADRVTYFDAYTRLFEDRYRSKELFLEFLTKADRKFLKKICESESEPAFFRAFAYFIFGMLCLFTGLDHHETVQNFDDCIEVCDSASDEEKERIVVGVDCSSYRVGAFLEDFRSRSSFTTAVREKLGVFIAWDQKGKDVAVEFLPGLACDCCKKSRVELGVKRFNVCSFCEMAYYCSVECQRKAWKEGGHKKVCRKEGEFRVGDVAFTLDPPENNSRRNHVRILGPGPEEKSWVVQFKDSDGDDEDIRIVPAERLMRMRPALWEAWDEKEIERVLGHLRTAAEAEGDTNSKGKSENDEEIVPDLVARGQRDVEDEG